MARRSARTNSAIAITARKGGKIDPRTLRFERRWVIFNGYSEASTVPPSWHGWMHHTVDTPPTQENYKPREWEKPHRPNLTGTAGAYRPPGSTLAANRRPKATGDYKAWSAVSRAWNGADIALSLPYSPC